MIFRPPFVLPCLFFIYSTFSMPAHAGSELAKVASHPSPPLSSSEAVSFVSAMNVPLVTSNSSPSYWANQIVHGGGKTFYIGRDPKSGYPTVWSAVDGNTTTTANVIQAYAAWDDSHGFWTLGIDSRGYLHAVGDMHSYPSGDLYCPSGLVEGSGYSDSHYPTSIACSRILYWKSNQPYDASSWTFMGHDAIHSPSAVAIFYPQFLHAPNGDLYMSFWANATGGPAPYYRRGEQGLHLYKYNVSMGTWSAIGNTVEHILTDTNQMNGITYYPVLFWNDSAGLWSDGRYARMAWKYSIRFDKNGGLHMCVPGIANLAYGGISDGVWYAFSPDGGTTWKKANGSVITSGGNTNLPIRGTGSVFLADRVVDSLGAYTVGDFTAVVADGNGVPACRAVNQGKQGQWDLNTGPYYRWNGTAWVADIGGQNASGSPYLDSSWGVSGLDGKLTFIDGYNTASMGNGSGPDIFRMDSFTGVSTRYTGILPGIDHVAFPSNQTLWDNQKLYMAATFGNPATSLQIVSMSVPQVTPSPTPTPALTKKFTYVVTADYYYYGPFNLPANAKISVSNTQCPTGCNVINQITDLAHNALTNWAPNQAHSWTTPTPRSVYVLTMTGLKNLGYKLTVAVPVTTN